MGFWSGLNRIVQGKPVFVDPNNQSVDVDAGPDINAATTQSGEKVIPVIEFENCKSRVDGSKMEVFVWVTNKGSVAVELDKIRMLGETIELDRILQPNEAREIRVYQGAVAKNDDDEMAHLQYKQRDNGDYFQADFTIEFDYDSQGFYEVEEFHPVRQIRDI